MRAIVNVNKNWGIGCDGDLLVNIPEDMKFFRTVTAGKTVIMGRKTLESFPGMKPLKGRVNIVLTGDPDRIKKESIAAADSFYIIDDTDKAASESSVRAVCEAAFENAELTKNGAKASDKHTVLAVLRDKPSVLRLSEAISKRLAETNECKESTVHDECQNGISDDIFIIGGASIYSLFLPECSSCIVTVNDSELKADTYFPRLDDMDDWELSERGDELLSSEGLHYSFNTYKRIKNTKIGDIFDF